MSPTHEYRASRSSRPARLWPGVLVVVLAASPSYGTAQDGAPRRAPPPASHFQPGQYVRLSAPGILIDEGRITSIEGDTLVVAAEGVEWLVQASLVEAISLREKQVGRYTFKGLLPGVLFGLGAELLLHQIDCPPQRQDCDPAAYGRAALIGGTLGGTLGLIVGLTNPQWRQLFP